MFRLACTSLLAVAALAALTTPASADYIQLDIPNRQDFVFDQSGVLYVTAGTDIVRYDTSSQSYLSSFTVGGSLVGIDLAPSGGTLAVADSTTQGSNNRIALVDTGTGAVTPVSFTRDFGEGGTFMVSWGGDGRVLTTSYFQGSGWVPLRQYDPSTGNTTVLGSVRQNSMLAASADRGTIGIVEANISSGPVHAFDVASGAIVASRDTGWFTYEVAVDPTGQTFVVPTYDGAFVLQRDGSTFDLVTTLGQYASYGPIGAAFSPDGSLLYTAEYDYSGTRSGVKVYDTTTWQQIASLDNYNFGWVGNNALVRGRTNDLSRRELAGRLGGRRRAALRSDGWKRGRQRNDSVCGTESRTEQPCAAESGRSRPGRLYLAPAETGVKKKGTAYICDPSERKCTLSPFFNLSDA